MKRPGDIPTDFSMAYSLRRKATLVEIVLKMLVTQMRAVRIIKP